jgi:hypothetical protein
MFCTNGEEIAEITTRNARQLYGLMWCASVIQMYIQLTLVVSNSVDSNFRLSRIFIEVPNFVVYKYI